MTTKNYCQRCGRKYCKFTDVSGKSSIEFCMACQCERIVNKNKELLDSL